jgi:SAM-dependent methyltransferase
MISLEDAKKKAAATYNAAADFYDHRANTFWARYGRRTIERLRLVPGIRVLDVCCGSGASAIPAAETVLPGGSVVGVDLAENRISDVDALRSLLAAADLTDSEVVAETGSQPISSPEDWWPMVMGSGYRGTVDQLSPTDRERVRTENFEFIRRAELRSVESNAVYAIVRKHH